jgi:hypothetical protein
VSDTGRRLRDELHAADAALAAAQDAGWLLPQEEHHAALNGGAIHQAGARRQRAADDCWAFHESLDADVDDVAAFIFMTGKPPRTRDNLPASQRNAVQVRNLVAVRLSQALATLGDGVKALVDEIVTALGHDVAHPEVQAIIAAAIRRHPMEMPPEWRPVGSADG